MTGKTFLLNTATRTSDLSRLSGEWFIVAQASGRIPLPWLCLFTVVDLDACVLTFMQPEQGDGRERHSPRKLSILNPSIAVADAKANLANAWPLFELLAGDEIAGRRRWLEAMRALDELPLEYLTIDPTRLLLAGDADANTRLYAAAFGNAADSRDAKRRIACIDPAAPPADNFAALDGAFLESGAWLRRWRSDDEARELQERIGTMASATSQSSSSAPRPGPAGAAPSPSPSPSADIWNDARLLEEGRAQAPVTIGRSLFMAARRYYSVRLTNRTDLPIRVREFAAFGDSERGWKLATRTGEWLSGEAFIAWFDAPADGWIAPGRTLAFLTHTDGDQREAWAFRCEDARQRTFVATAVAEKTETGGRFNGAGWVLGAPIEPLGDDLPLVRREIGRLVGDLVGMARETMQHALTIDMDGLRWLDETLERSHRQGHGPSLGEAMPLFGAFTGHVVMNIGSQPGEWVRLGEVLCVHVAGATFLPFQKVIKRLIEGRGADGTILGVGLASGSAGPTASSAAGPSASGTGSPPARAAHRQTMRSQVSPHPADSKMSAVVGQLREELAQHRRRLQPIAWKNLAGARPPWMRPGDALNEAVDRQQLLMTEGDVVWAAVVQANKLLYERGDLDCPAMVVYSRDPDLDARPSELRAIAQRIYKLKGTTPRDPVERAIAAKVTNEMDRTMGWALPVELTARHVSSAAVMIHRRHIPDGVLTCASFPLFVHRATKAVMVVPHVFWPQEMLALWKRERM